MMREKGENDGEREVRVMREKGEIDGEREGEGKVMERGRGE